MWSFFSTDPLKGFGYDIEEVQPGLEDVSLWKLHKGKKKVVLSPVLLNLFATHLAFVASKVFLL